MAAKATQSVSLHGRTYKLPTRPTVIVCVDGFDPEYLSKAIEDGIVPTMKRFIETGFHTEAKCSMPSVTNANNMSIITGAPTAVHGIATNYFLDRETREEIMITDDSLMRGSTILAEMASAGARTAAITAKDKLRKLLQRGLDASSSICYSSQLATDETLAWLGRSARPDQYSAELSLFVLEAGLKLLREKGADLFYLTLSDFVQHKYAPGSDEANAFFRKIDNILRGFIDQGAVVAVTGDHGMSDKSNAEGNPNVLFVQDELEKKFGTGCVRVICPIADPFVKHHGALGGFVRVYVNEPHGDLADAMSKYITSFAQVELSMLKEEAASTFEMPLDREGDFIVVATASAVLGAKEAEHDLTGLKGHSLRSHGGLSEQDVPILVSEPIVTDRNSNWRNYDVFDLVLNYAQ